MLALHEKLAEAKIERERTVIWRQAAADGQIDNLVHELYGLTDEEIRIVEEATRLSRAASPRQCKTRAYNRM